MTSEDRSGGNADASRRSFWGKRLRTRADWKASGRNDVGTRFIADEVTP